ncbi:DUF2516 family protein [Cellulomonas soli]|uniref:Membrane protein n=1 Tax=Cellulomonas soli TaxID=931535 RepID=A0A512PHT3_9CELL|nr:DUF2516 family protein [Cellulomonas soli]NYI59259.1 hypothetical protein [Cellulomonas soli]GEP70764.1 membrane protein [Cellulomonas soli]
MIANLQILMFLAFYLVIFGLSLWALVDLATRPSRAFVDGGKRTKQFWGLILGPAAAIAFMAIPAPLGLGFLSFLALGSAVASIVYLVDVRPAIAPYSRKKGPRGPSSRGGW